MANFPPNQQFSNLKILKNAHCQKKKHSHRQITKSTTNSKIFHTAKKEASLTSGKSEREQAHTQKREHKQS